MDVSIPGPSGGLCKGAPAFKYSACVRDGMTGDEFVKTRSAYTNSADGKSMITAAACTKMKTETVKNCVALDSVARTDTCDAGGSYCSAMINILHQTTRCSTTESTKCMPADTVTLCKRGTASCPHGVLVQEEKKMCCKDTKSLIASMCDISGSKTDWTAAAAKDKTDDLCRDTNCYEHISSAVVNTTTTSNAARTGTVWIVSTFALVISYLKVFET